MQFNNEEAIDDGIFYLPWEEGCFKFKELVSRGHDPLILICPTSVGIIPLVANKMLLFSDEENRTYGSCYEIGPFRSISDAESHIMISEFHTINEWYEKYEGETPFRRVDNSPIPDFSKYGYRAVEYPGEEYYSIERIESLAQD